MANITPWIDTATHESPETRNDVDRIRLSRSLLCAGPAMSAIFWFRKSLRLHDNPALTATLATRPTSLVPLVVLDPHFRSRVGPLRMNFYLQCLRALHDALAERGSRLVVLQGDPVQLFRSVVAPSASLVAWEHDTEPYARDRDAAVRRALEEAGVDVLVRSGHTLWDLERPEMSREVPTTYGGFLKVGWSSSSSSLVV